MCGTVVMINEFNKLVSSRLENNRKDDISCFLEKLPLLEKMKTWILNNHKVKKLIKIKKKRLNKKFKLKKINSKKRSKNRRKKRRKSRINLNLTQTLIGRS